MNWKQRYSSTEDCAKCNSIKSTQRSAFEGLKSEGKTDKEYRDLKLQGQNASIDLGRHMSKEHPIA